MKCLFKHKLVYVLWRFYLMERDLIIPTNVIGVQHTIFQVIVSVGLCFQLEVAQYGLQFALEIFPTWPEQSGLKNCPGYVIYGTSTMLV
jgi:hypothetical protein